MIMWHLIAVAFILSVCMPAYATIPSDAQRYKRELIRSAHAIWGIDAPVATFAAQIHQESSWQADVQSPAGAKGLAQFMPTTASWISGAYPKNLADNAPYNPAWAIQALITYNQWHYNRIHATTECDRWAYVLSAYNGGLGWVNRDRNRAKTLGLDPDVYWGVVETVNAGRSSANFKENRGYPQRIIYRWQPDYINNGWGLGVCND